jgi:diaminopimelate epimerase
MNFSNIQRFNITLTPMTIQFNKYQGAGNDFVMIDNRNNNFNPEDYTLINRLCDRRFGIGADGLILICTSNENDFEMKYFNSDGFIGSMCGNGGRCSADFAIKSGIAGKKLSFKAADGLHTAIAEDGIIRLSMNDPKVPILVNGSYFINTGSPHYVIFRNDIDKIDVNTEGKNFRWASEFAPGGTNVNFVELQKDGIYVRTFERGVEEETLACGTGVTASAIAAVLAGHIDTKTVKVKAKGGNLSVSFNISDAKVSDIWLSGPATFVYSGTIEV